jgi:hypothetical protein
MRYLPNYCGCRLGSFLQEHDADLNYTCEHESSGETDIYVGESRAAPLERPVEFFTFFAHASPKENSPTVVAS